MTVNLYYVEGISRIDTPYFATKTSQASLEKQEEFFSNHLVKSVELSYYPPHYRNSIRFEDEDLTIKDSVNYLSLEYNDKTYYYFIDDVAYISESLIEVTITMDVIQTYMFEIYISNGIIERKFIDRWLYDDDGYVINRQYLRENASTNEFMLYSKTYVNTDASKYTLFLKQTKKDKHETVGNLRPSSPISYVLTDGSFAYKMCISSEVPYDLKFGPAAYYIWVDYLNPNTHVLTMQSLVSIGSALAETLDMYVCPFNPFSDVQISVPTGLTCAVKSTNDNMPLYCDYLNFDDMPSVAVYYFKEYSGVNMIVHNSSYNFGFIRQYELNKPFHMYYMPMLLDDNYLRYSFGTVNASTTYPLFKLNSNLIYGHYAFDPSNGTRIYYINDLQNSDMDRYNTITIDTNILSIDLKNDPWAQYIANNKNRWAQLNVQNIASISAAGASYAGSTSKIGKIGVDKSSNTSYGFTRFKNRNMKTGQFTGGSSLRKTRTTMNASSRDVYGDIPTDANAGGLAGSVLNAGASVLNQYYTEKNLLAAPSSLSQLGECVNGMASQSHLICKGL